MIKNIGILPEAWADVIKITSYYSSISEDLSLQFERSLIESLDNIRTFPAMYPVKYRNVRRKLIKKFPYAIYYYIHASFVRIIAVVHQRENPQIVRNKISRGRD